MSRRSLAVVLAGFAVVMLSELRARGDAHAAAWRRRASRPAARWARCWRPSSRSAIGFTGGTLLLLALLAVGVSLFTGLSWLRVAELFGAGLESIFAFARARVEARRDREEGRIKAQERDEAVEEAKRAFEEHEPIRIEMPPVEVPRSERVVREKQVPLFADLPDSPLPAALAPGRARHARRAAHAPRRSSTPRA